MRPGDPGAARAATLDAIYRPWTERWRDASGIPDRLRRHPEYLITIAERLACMPDPSTTVCITGSKGKGGTARQIAWALQAAGNRVGLVLSPHERDHEDRIRIDNRPIPTRLMVDYWRRLAPAVEALLSRCPAPYYPAPSGLFLLIALQWFRDEKVDYWILEAGRGGASDEAGCIPAAAGVVTALFDEHLDVLGPGRDELAREKLGLYRHVQSLFVSEGVREFARQQGERLPANAEVSTTSADWRNQQRELARRVCDYLGVRTQVPVSSDPLGSAHMSGLTLLPWINEASIEPETLNNGQESVLGISEDKQREPFLRALRQFGVSWSLSLDTGAHSSGAVPDGFDSLGAVNLQGDGADLRRLLEPLMEDAGVNLIGNQQLMSLARRGFDLPLAEPCS